VRHAIALLALATACGATTAHVRSPAVVAPLPTPVPDADGRTGPLIVADGIAYVADEDPPSVRAFASRDLSELWSAPLDVAPAHLALAGGRIFASLRTLDRVDIVDEKTHEAKVFARPCVEPIGLATGASGELFVACGWSHRLVALAGDGTTAWSVDLPLEPRAVLVKGERVFVSHASGGKLSVVDTRTHAAHTISLAAGLVAPRQPHNPTFARTSLGLQLSASNGFALTEHAGKIYAASLVVSPSEGSSYYGDSLADSVVYELDPAYSEAYLSAQIEFRTRDRGCRAPRGVAVRSTSSTLVACPGEDSLVEQAADGLVLRRIFVGAGANAIVVDGPRDEALVWSQQKRTLARVDLSAGVVRDTRQVAGEPHTPWIARRGRELFEATKDPRITFDGRGCVTCHPDGRSDGITWTTPEGKRRTLILAGRLQGTSPYGWTRESATIPDYIKETMQRLQGRGLPPEDLDALARYVEQLRVPSTIQLADVSRGREIFESKPAGCSGCHAGDRFTDHRAHTLDSPTAFDTPSLLYLSHSTSYFHDGRYDSLRELLDDTDGAMGHTKYLSPSDRRALEAYLSSL
jgi:mono/diheme cytochrome c family protein